MNTTTDKNRLGRVETIRKSIPYHTDPTALFHTLCEKKTDCLLLESAEIESKLNLKSLLLIDSAVRITCNNHHVNLHALSQNGIHLLKQLKTNLPDDIEHHATHEQLDMYFGQPDTSLDEDSRLKQYSSFDALRLIQNSFDIRQHDKYAIFLGGLFAYDLVANYEPLGEVLSSNHCPDYVFYVAETLLIIDHQAQSCQLQATLFNPEIETKAALEIRSTDIAARCQSVPTLPSAKQLDRVDIDTNISDEDYCAIVSKMKEYIVRGDIFQVVPSRSFLLPCPSPLAAYKQLKKSNPSPYMFYIQDQHFTLFGASPESALKYTHDTNEIQIYPIAGTRGRGKHADGSINLDLDGRIELDLRTDRKENAEHMMLVDLARNDVARISKAGTRHVADLLKVDRYSHVMHLVSRVVGQLRDDLDALHAYQACMNMGTLTGAPKIRAMQLVYQYEQERRGSYGGAVGYLTGDGDLDTCIVIRSAYVENGIARVQAGAGIVYDSDPQSEADETRGKAQAVISAIQTAHQTKH